MRTFKQDKLWRDKMIAFVEQNYGSQVYWKKLNDTEFDKALRIKLQEEADEVATAKNKKNLVEELGDLYEVIDSLIALHSITHHDIKCAQREKRERLGGFEDRTFVDRVDHPEGSAGEKYCLADPDKYPEIVNQSLSEN